jgi:transposase
LTAYSIALRKKIVQSLESLEKGHLQESETACRFDVNRSTVQRYIKQLYEEGSLAPKKKPASRSKLETRAPCCCLSKTSRVVPGPPIDRGGDFFMGSVELR